jgi:hypothetical protein
MSIITATCPRLGEKKNREKVAVITEKEPKNDLFLNCQRKTKELSKKGLLNVAPASTNVRELWKKIYNTGSWGKSYLE